MELPGEHTEEQEECYINLTFIENLSQLKELPVEYTSGGPIAVARLCIVDGGQPLLIHIGVYPTGRRGTHYPKAGTSEAYAQLVDGEPITPRRGLQRRIHPLVDVQR